MIYLIKSGHYSDTDIHGYFTNAEDAYTYCELHNQRLHKDAEDRLGSENVDEGFFFHREYRVEPVREIRAELPPRPVQYYFFRYEFRRQPSEGAYRWVMDHPEKPWNILPKDKVMGDPQEVWGWKVRGFSGFPESYYYAVEVILKKWDTELAEKIAQDYFYQVIAQRDGLSV